MHNLLHSWIEFLHYDFDDVSFVPPRFEIVLGEQLLDLKLFERIEPGSTWVESGLPWV